MKNYANPENRAWLDEIIDNAGFRNFWNHAASYANLYEAYPYLNAPEIDDTYFEALQYSYNLLNQLANGNAGASAYTKAMKEAITHPSFEERSFQGTLGKLNYAVAQTVSDSKADLKKFNQSKDFEIPHHLKL